MPAGRAAYRCQGLSPLLRDAPRKRGIQQSPRVLWLSPAFAGDDDSGVNDPGKNHHVFTYPRSRSALPMPATSAFAELDLCRFERRGVAIHAHVRWRAKNAGDRPEPLEIRGRAALFVNSAHGKFATEDRVIPAAFVRRRAEAGRAKRQTLAPVLRLAGERRCSPRAARQHAQVMPDRSQRHSARFISGTVRLTRRR